MLVHRSNRIEALLDALCDVVREPLANPLAPDCIVVQGRGMERWLSQQLAERFGVWANPDFPFPRKLIERGFAAVLGARNEEVDPYAPEVLLWTIADLLPELLDRPQLTEVRAYLEAEVEGRRGLELGLADFRLLALAERLAATFDQYVVYRPKLIADWEAGRFDDWQALLWRRIVQRHGALHVAARARRWIEALGAKRTFDLPERVCLFGVSTLPPLYVELLNALDARTDVHLFLLSPSREYWAWIRSRRELWRQATHHGADSRDFEEAVAEAEGNPLLASLGRLGRDFQQILEVGVDYRDDDRYLAPGHGTMLATLQSDILELQHRRRANPAASPLALDAADESIRVHACHSPMREVEVLHDQLLELFERDRSLEPRDVIVLSPDIDAYAPFVDAVFGADSGVRIPYRVADRRVRATDDIIDTFLEMLATLRGRFGAPEVMDLLSRQPIYSQVGMVTEELDLVREWIRDAGIRWGVDAAHRQSLGQPGAGNTWRFGLDRLLAGYAMEGREQRLFGGVLPYDDMEGTIAELLGKVTECLERLFSLRQRFSAPRTLPEWRDELTEALAALLASNDETAHQHRHIRSTLAELAEQAEAGGFHGRIDLDSMRVRLEAAFERSAPGRAFLTGGVTFCAMVPMRSIPFRVVCLLGMNDASFPRVQRPPGFDLMAQHPQLGDRSSRDDDRYLFLEALLAARQRLIITYVGQSVRDNAEIPPSVVVSELLDVIDESFEWDESGTWSPTQTSATTEARAPCSVLRVPGSIIRHPLQPFSPRYFDGKSALFSYARRHFEGAKRLSQPRTSVPRFVDVPLPAGDAERVVTVDDLARFFENPARGFLQRRLGLSLGRDSQPLDDREPLELDQLERWKIGTSLLGRAIDGDDIRLTLPLLRAAGVLPPGTLGEYPMTTILPEVDGLARATARFIAGTKLEPLEIDCVVAGTRLLGRLEHLWPAGQVQYQYSRTATNRELGLWIRHVVLNCAASGDLPRTTILIGRGGKGTFKIVRLKPVPEALERLRQLVELYWLGQLVPLPLLPQCSRAFAEALRSNPDTEKALRKARKLLRPERGFGDGDDAYFQQVYGDHDPFAAVDWSAELVVPTFARLARQIFDPLFDHREELDD